YGGRLRCRAHFDWRSCQASDRRATHHHKTIGKLHHGKLHGLMPPLVTQILSVPGGKIFQITMNRPDVHNCVNGEMARLFTEAWSRFRDDDDLTVCVLHGEGDK